MGGGVLYCILRYGRRPPDFGMSNNNNSNRRRPYEDIFDDEDDDAEYDRVVRQTRRRTSYY